MKCEFSETQFVFGVMNELVNNYLQKKSGWTALYFPTQRKEMRLGYDVKIKNPVRTRSVFFNLKFQKKRLHRRENIGLNLDSRTMNLKYGQIM